MRSELTFTGTGAAVTPLKGQGSHMLLSFAQAGALAVLDGPAGVFEAGTSVPVIPLEEVRS